MDGQKKINAPKLKQTKKRERTNGFLGVQLFTGELFFKACKSAKSENIAEYFVEMTLKCKEMGYNKIDIFLIEILPIKTKCKNNLEKKLPIQIWK